VGDKKLVDLGKEMARRVDYLVRNMSPRNRYVAAAAGANNSLLNFASPAVAEPSSFAAAGQVAELNKAAEFWGSSPRISTTLSEPQGALCLEEVLTAEVGDNTTVPVEISFEGKPEPTATFWTKTPDAYQEGLESLWGEYIDVVYSLPPCAASEPGWKRYWSTGDHQAEGVLFRDWLASQQQKIAELEAELANKYFNPFNEQMQAIQRSICCRCNLTPKKPVQGWWYTRGSLRRVCWKRSLLQNLQSLRHSQVSQHGYLYPTADTKETDPSGNAANASVSGERPTAGAPWADRRRTYDSNYPRGFPRTLTDEKEGEAWALHKAEEERWQMELEMWKRWFEVGHWEDGPPCLEDYLPRPVENGPADMRTEGAP
jgi:hypothetical protein